MKKLYFLFILLISSSVSFGQSAGDIAFVGFNADGDDDFAIVVLADLPANTIIYITDNEPNATGNGLADLNEGEMSWDTGASIITAGTVVLFTDTDNPVNPSYGSSVGTISSSSAPNLAGGGDALYAVLGDPTTNSITVWLAGIQNEAGNEGANFSATGLIAGSTFVNFYTSGSPDGGVYSGVITDELNWSDYLTLINNPANWTTDTSNGENVLTDMANLAASNFVLPVERQEIENFSTYPNPVTNGEFFINSANNATKDVRIFDMLGKQVYAKSVTANERVNVVNLNTGIYILKVIEEGKTATRKLVIK